MTLKKAAHKEKPLLGQPQLYGITKVTLLGSTTKVILSELLTNLLIPDLST